MEINKEKSKRGRVIKAISSFYYVMCDEIIFECRARGKFKHEKLSPLVGDLVEFKYDKNGGIINRVEERINLFKRPSVANVTQAILIFTINNPKINLDLYNRITFLCEYYNLKVKIVLNKCDLYDEKLIDEFKNDINKMGYECFEINKNDNDELYKLLNVFNDELTMFCGVSGVGKSTIINRIVGYELMKTNIISDKISRGKHTTRHCELISAYDGLIVDTPGFSNLNMDFINWRELRECVKEFQEINYMCKFNGCTHDKEPKCKIIDEVNKGNIAKHRYESYIRLVNELKKVKEW